MTAAVHQSQGSDPDHVGSGRAPTLYKRVSNKK